MVAPDRLRFDFTHLAALTPEQITEAERRVNECIRANLPVHAEVSSYQEARASGALAIFGERYGEQVRAVCIQGQSTRAHLDDQSGCFSKELCGGTHVDRTGEIGLFLILSETGIGAGTRRIEAVTGRGAEAHVREHLAVLDQLARQLRSDPLSLTDRVSDLMQALEQTQQERQRRRRSTLEDQARSLAASPRRLAGRVQFVSAVVDAETPDELRAMADKVREGLRDYVVVLGADFDEKSSILVNVAHDLLAQGVNAREIARRLGSRIGGSGGGRDTLAQAGGRGASELRAALAEAPSIVESLLTLSQSAGG